MTINISELDVIIEQVKKEFKSMLVKRKELILKLGKAYEKVVSNPESVCEEIKNVLQEEIAEKIISSRDVERYCPAEWKKKTKPKNDSLSISKNKVIAIDQQGQSTTDNPLDAKMVDSAEKGLQRDRYN